MSFSEFLSLFLFCSAITFSPGPNTTLSTALAANSGLKHAIKFCLAVPTGWLLLLLACVFGLGAFIIKIPFLYWLIKFGGCVYMGWLAYKLFNASALTHLKEAPLEMNYSRGVLLQFVNIKAWMLSLTISGQWIIQSDMSLTNTLIYRFTAVCAIVMAFAFFSNFTYALLGSILRQWLAKENRLVIFNRSLASILIVTAVWMLFS